MENETEDIITSTNNEEEEVELLDDEPTEAEEVQEEVEEKPIESQEAKYARLKRQTEQLGKKLGKEEKPSCQATASRYAIAQRWNCSSSPIATL